MNDKKFSLSIIELLIILAIIIGAGYFSTIMRSSKNKENLEMDAIVQCFELNQALSKYKNVYQKWPSTLSDLAPKNNERNINFYSGSVLNVYGKPIHWSVDKDEDGYADHPHPGPKKYAMVVVWSEIPGQTKHAANSWK